MKLLGALVCGALLLCVTASASALVNDALDGAAGARAAGCTFYPKCDSTGEEKIPIPCDGFCDKYFFCQNGNPVMKDCGRNLIGLKLYFNNYNRQCEVGFKDCGWWRDDKTTTPTSDPSNPTGTTDPSKPTGSNPPDGSTPTTGTTVPTTQGPCIYNADCDATGTQKKPIPCAGFCNRYYLCVEGVPTVKTCDTFQNFNNVTRECSITFKDCNWYRAFETTTTSPATDKPTSPTVTGSTQRPTTSRPNSTTNKPNRASSLVYSTSALFGAVLMPLVSRII